MSKDEDITIDFSKIKNFFSGKSNKKTDEDKSTGSTELMLFMKKYSMFLLILIPIMISIFIRVQPAYLPLADDWSEQTMYNSIKSNIASQIGSKYPLMPDAQKDKQAQEQLDQLLKDDNYKNALDQQIEQLANSYRARMQDESGQTYLLAIDPYFWWKHSKNIVENGHPGEELRDGEPYDTYMLAPNGRPVPIDMFHAYATAYLYKFVKFFNSRLPLKNVLFYMPVIISTLAVIPAFFIGRKLAGNISGLVSGIMIAAHPVLIGRTSAGFADTDPYNFFFPLLISWIFLSAFEEKNIKKITTYTAIASVATVLYAGTWNAWWYIFDFLLISAGLYFIYSAIKYAMSKRTGNLTDIIWTKNENARNTIIISLLYIVLTIGLTSLFINTSTAMTPIMSPLIVITIHDVGMTVWPNVFTTVAEQNEANFSTIVHNLGGKLLVTIAVLGIISILAFVFKNKDQDYKVKYAILLMIWFIGSYYGSTKGIRFILLMIGAFGIAVGTFWGMIYNYLPRFSEKEFGISKRVAQISIILLLAVSLFYYPIKQGHATSLYEMPSMNDAWYDSLKAIDDNASKDAIINSWWDFGHWFKRIGNRPVTFDGTSQNTPQAHWIGLSLLTNNEKESIGVLKMIDCGGNNAFEALDSEINNSHKTIDILYDIVLLDKEDARQELEKYVNTENATKVLNYTHCKPPENYFITSADMVGKASVWGHFGAWDFKKATMVNKLQKIKNSQEGIDYIKAEFDYDTNEATSLYNEIKSLDKGREANDWIAPWPSYYSGPDSCSNEGNDTIFCLHSFQGQSIMTMINLTSMDAFVVSQNQKAAIRKFSYIGDDGFTVKEYNNSIPFGLSLFRTSEDSYHATIMDPLLVDSMFNRLFYYNGYGLDSFDLFSDKTSFRGERIIVWKVDWESNPKPTIDQPQNESAET